MRHELRHTDLYVSKGRISETILVKKSADEVSTLLTGGGAINR